MSKSLHHRLLGTAFAGMMLLPTGHAVAIEFRSPTKRVPKTTIGGGTRGNVQFASPGRSGRPRTSIGGGTRGNVQFALPGRSGRPKTSIGGGTRKDVQFALPGRSGRPRTSIGGGTRKDVQFALPGGSGRPTTSIGGGTRKDVQFALPGGSGRPTTSIGGGTRKDVQFAVPGGSGRPQTSVGGGTRKDVQFAAPGGSGRPKTSVGGGTRNEVQFPFTALLPQQKHGNTISARPTIFAYLPAIDTDELFFSLQDEAGNFHYHTTIDVSESGGIISVTLPESAPELKEGKDYLWYLAPIERGGILKPDNLAVTGWVTRVSADISPQANPIKLATNYASAGIWYDTVAVLAQAQAEQPFNEALQVEWQDLLKQFQELEHLSAAPILLSQE